MNKVTLLRPLKLALKMTVHQTRVSGLLRRTIHSNQHPRYTQKPICSYLFTNNIWSPLLYPPVIEHSRSSTWSDSSAASSACNFMFRCGISLRRTHLVLWRHRDTPKTINTGLRIDEISRFRYLSTLSVQDILSNVEKTSTGKTKQKITRRRGMKMEFEWLTGVGVGRRRTYAPSMKSSLDQLSHEQKLYSSVLWSNGNVGKPNPFSSKYLLFKRLKKLIAE